MSTTTLNLLINQNETFSQVVTLDPVINLTGYAGTCQIRQYPSPLSAVVASPTITLDADPTLGKFTIAMTAAITRELPVSGTAHSDKTTYYYDVNMTSAATVIRVLQGTVAVSPSVTRI